MATTIAEQLSFYSIDQPILDDINFDLHLVAVTFGLGGDSGGEIIAYTDLL